MKRTFLHCITLSACVLTSVACGTAEESYRKLAHGGMDAIAVQPVEFSFSLPSRVSLGLDAALLQQNMSGYAWRIEGQGEKCTDTAAHESFGAYEDARTYIVQLLPTCNYLVNIMVGELAVKPALALTKTINYAEHIQPIIQESCISCHSDYKDPSVVAKNASSIVSHVENETMPPNEPLDGASIALFLAWGDDGYQQQDPHPTPVTAADSALSAVYYRNNANDMIMAYELLGRGTFELRRNLWIQPAGEALGLKTAAIPTFRISRPDGSSGSAQP